ncbi:MAG TPA: hypothetical protein VGQ97_08750 [Xanthobacteraceae bacterium]|jgi:hypothetical protein|nr:hypothetical protein [Xanthobacteraceae bacterium]HXL67818.1 hypothetical protein [Xanthobacteraceae bacterium]
MRDPKIVLLLIGALVGGLIGYLSRPESAEIKIGPLNIQITGPGAAGGGGELTTPQLQHIGLIALIGAALGFGVGFVVERRKV